MNHARRAAARGFSTALARPWRPAATAAALAVLLLAGPVAAQLGTSDLPTSSLDPEIDPSPFDARRAIRDYLVRVLPGRWWANEPEFYLGSYSVMIHVPDDWRGNPTSALMNLCPPSYNPLWLNLDRIEFVPFYQKAARARATCRKG